MDIHKPKPVRNWREFLTGAIFRFAESARVQWLHGQLEAPTG